MDIHTKTVKKIKIQVKAIPCLVLPDPTIPKIVETDASDLGYGGILKQTKNNKEQIIAFASKRWNNSQQNYSTIKKKNLSNSFMYYKISNWTAKPKVFTSGWL